MASFDFGSVSDYKFALASDVTANTNAASVDTAGFEGVAFVTSVGTSNLNADAGRTISVSFLESDTDNISNAVAVDAGRVVSNDVVNASNTAFQASVVPTKRYLFGQLTISADLTANVHCIGALGYPHTAPTS